jgi:hypothetical protein
MSIAAVQASKFYEQVVRERAVFTFTDEGSFLVYPVRGQDVVPFWSSRARLDKIQREHEKYRSYTCDEISLTSFLEKTLPDLAAENIAVGVNWSGERLTGYDVSVSDLIGNLEHWRKKVAAEGRAG